MKLVDFCGLSTVDAMTTTRDFGFPVDANVDELHGHFVITFITSLGRFSHLFYVYSYAR